MDLAEEEFDAERGREVAEGVDEEIDVVKGAERGLAAAGLDLQGRNVKLNRESAGESEAREVVAGEVTEGAGSAVCVGWREEEVEVHGWWLAGAWADCGLRQASILVCQCGPLSRSAVPMAVTSSLATGARAVRV